MRQVFTSVRLENVERVEKMLNDAGIATKVNQGRSWKGVSRREFSYSNKNHDPSQQPSLWVIKPDDFKFFSVDGNAKNESDVFKCVAQINPSYILVRRLLKYGQAHGGYVEWERATMLRREGQNREDGLSARIAGREDFRQTLASTDWQLVSNPSRHESLNRHRKVGPGSAERHETCSPRSRSRFSSPLDMSKALP